jgi:E3 ubiquitin-protein ligase TRIP12
VERLRQELEDKFQELGPNTVIGCTWPPIPPLAPDAHAYFLVVAETVVGAATGVVAAPKGYFKGKFLDHGVKEASVLTQFSYEVCLR